MPRPIRVILKDASTWLTLGLSCAAVLILSIWAMMAVMQSQSDDARLRKNYGTVSTGVLTAEGATAQTTRAIER
ncbi:hypothetical protein RMQ97_11780 [Maricaulis sp. D1M11]|uniref:hypothetical protein n=1 Tax=Maricaulis sp. D1M11 TaxID=3076117 RepID=UPI0039B4248D